MNKKLTEDQIIKFLEEESDLALSDGLPETSRKLSEAANLIRRLLKNEGKILEYLELY